MAFSINLYAAFLFFFQISSPVIRASEQKKPYKLT